MYVRMYVCMHVVCMYACIYVLYVLQVLYLLHVLYVCMYYYFVCVMLNVCVCTCTKYVFLIFHRIYIVHWVFRKSNNFPKVGNSPSGLAFQNKFKNLTSFCPNKIQNLKQYHSITLKISKSKTGQKLLLKYLVIT